MDTVMIKKKLIEKINDLENTKLLEELYKFLNSEESSEKMFNLTDEQVSEIQKAQQQIADGDYVTHEKATRDIEEWLNE